VPGTFGDPFRVLDTLPGVVPMFGGLPYVYVRGAPPAATVYYYDDIAIPQLFHFGLLAAVVHPAMLGDLLFYPSVAPARYGRKTGGVFGAEGPDVHNDKLTGELELRLLDVSGMLNVPLAGGGRVIGAARYGYPGLAASLFVKNFTLAYWDYQLRADLPIGNHDRLQLAWFGSYDKAGTIGKEITITFHRFEARLLRELRELQVGAAIQLGFDRTAATDGGFSVGGMRFGPRFWLKWKPNDQLRLRVGGDMLATAGHITTDNSNGNSGGNPMPNPDPNTPPPDPMPGDMMNNGGDGLSQGDPISQQVRGRNMIGMYAELNLQPTQRWEFGLGVRGDLWTTGSVEAHAVEPRVTATYHPNETSDLYVAGGLAYQPAVFPIPIPGLADIVLDRGLQRAVQSEAGYRADIGDELRLETALFLNHYTGLLFLNVAFDCNQDSTDAACNMGGGFPRSTSNAYGWEVFLKRAAHHRISGWLSYTFGGATATGPTGRDFIPETDVRHFGNGVVQFDLGSNWKLGFRAFFRTGRVSSFGGNPVNPNERLPGYARLDAMISNRWPTRWGHMRFSLEWFNTTFSREAVGFQCDPPIVVVIRPRSCSVQYAPAIVIPNIGLRGEF
jgi:hypothetical protein